MRGRKRGGERGGERGKERGRASERTRGERAGRRKRERERESEGENESEGEKEREGERARGRGGLGPFVHAEDPFRTGVEAFCSRGRPIPRRASARFLSGVRPSGACLAGVWRLAGVFLASVWRAFWRAENRSPGKRTANERSSKNGNRRNPQPQLANQHVSKWWKATQFSSAKN